MRKQVDNQITIRPEEDTKELEVDRKPEIVEVDGITIDRIEYSIPTGPNRLADLTIKGWEWADGILTRCEFSDFGWWRAGSKIVIKF